jgi:DNA repair protein RadC
MFLIKICYISLKNCYFFNFISIFTIQNIIIGKRMQHSIKTWSPDDQPREKMIAKGKNALSDAELIAILLGSGNTEESAVDLAKHILRDYQNDIYQLGLASIEALKKYKGIGDAKAVTVAAALELGRRRKESSRKEIVVITGSQSAFEVFQPYFQDLSNEEFWILHLNRGNRVLLCENISKGGMAGTVVDPKVVYRRALELQSAAIVVAHNHPSGNLQASQQDIDITKKLVNAGKMLEISFLDHLIIHDNAFYSFADEGML